MKLNKMILPIISLVIALSCQDVENMKHIQGKWKCVQWSVAEDQDANNSQDVHFTFLEDKTYSYTNGGMVEKGTYKIEGGNLYTTPENQLEMSVKLEKLTADSMIFQMSRGGMPETMTLIKE